MKTLCVTQSRWFNSLFEVPVIRRIPRRCQEYAGDAQANQNLIAHLRRRRRRSPFPADECRAKKTFVSQTG